MLRRRTDRTRPTPTRSRARTARTTRPRRPESRAVRRSRPTRARAVMQTSPATRRPTISSKVRNSDRRSSHPCERFEAAPSTPVRDVDSAQRTTATPTSRSTLRPQERSGDRQTPTPTIGACTDDVRPAFRWYSSRRPDLRAAAGEAEARARNRRPLPMRVRRRQPRRRHPPGRARPSPPARDGGSAGDRRGRHSRQPGVPLRSPTPRGATRSSIRRDGRSVASGAQCRTFQDKNNLVRIAVAKGRRPTRQRRLCRRT